MNERFKELAERAGLVTLQHSDEWLDVEKFAELLVRECMEQCSKALVKHTGQPSVTHNYAVGLCQDSIKEHFGVEE